MFYVGLILRSLGWIRKHLKNSKEGARQHLLKHEQGHYDIARVVSGELKSTLNAFSFDGKRVRYQADSIRRVFTQKLRKLEHDYDKDTNHSRVLEEQKRWNGKIEKALEEKKFN